MEKNPTLPYTTILHQVREELGITMEDYCVADSVYHLANNPKSKIKGWCFSSKKYISEFIKLNERYVFRSLKKLIEKNLIEKDEITKHIRTTEIWYDKVVMPKAKIEYDKMSEGMTKCQSGVRQNVIPTMTKCQSYNNTYNNNYKKKILADKSAHAEIMQFYSNLVSEKFGFRPKIDAADGKLLKSAMSMGSDTIRALIEWYLNSGKCRELQQVSLSACLSKDSINKWRLSKHQPKHNAFMKIN